MALLDIFDSLPSLLPEGGITVKNEAHEFTVHNYSGGGSHTVEKYVLDKAPFTRVDEVTGTLDGSTGHTFVEGTDYRVIDSDTFNHLKWNEDNWNDGDWAGTATTPGLDTIDWSIGGDNPDDNTDFYVDYVTESIISRYVGSFDDDVDEFDASMDDVIDSHQVDNATGQELDRLGAMFGEIGKRRGRSDQDYRVFIKSIVQSFKGQGTIPGLRFAVAAGLGVDDSSVSIEEDFTNVEYTVVVDDWTSHNVSVVEDMAQLADPSGVEMAGTQYNVDTEQVGVSDTATVAAPVDATEDVGVDDSASTPSPTTASDDVGADDSTTVTEHGVQWNSGDWNSMYWDE